MCLIECDLEEGTISEYEASSMEYDDDMYLDRFPDPFSTNAGTIY